LSISAKDGSTYIQIFLSMERATWSYKHSDAIKM